MSQSSLATSQQSKALQNPPARSAWAKGPPLLAATSPTIATNQSALSSPTTASSSRPQSPKPNGAPTPTHSRKPSTLGPGAAAVPIKEGVSVPRGIGITGAGRNSSGSSFNFGTIDNNSAAISSSPTPAAPISNDTVNIKSFGTLPTNANGPAPGQVSTPSTSVATGTPKALTPSTSATSTPPLRSSTPSTTGGETTSLKKKFDVNKLFQGPSAASSSAPPPPSPSTNVYPASHPRRLSVTESKIPASPQQRGGPLPGGTQPYSPYPAQAGSHMRPPQQSASPRSPQFSRGMPGGAPGPGVNGNGQGRGGPPLQSGPGPGPGPGGPPVGSPRLGHQPMPPQQPQQQQMQMQMPPQGWAQPYYYYPGYENIPPPQGYWQPPPAPSHAHAHIPHLQPSHPHGVQPIPHSPRTPNMQNLPPLQSPSTPILPSVTIPPTQSRLNGPPSSLSSNAPAFVPKQRVSTVKITTPGGEEVNFSKPPDVASPSVLGPISHIPPFNRSNESEKKRQQIRIESEESKKKRVAEEEAKKAKELAEKERVEKAELAKFEEAKRKEEDKIKKEVEEKEKKEREEREEKEQVERERVEKEKAEAEKVRLEAEEKKRKDEEEEAARLKEEEEKEKKRKEEEAEKERLKREEEDRERKAVEDKEKAETEARTKQQAELERLKAETENFNARQHTQVKDMEVKADHSPSPAPSSTLPPTSASLPPRPANGLPAGLRRPIPGPLDLSSTVNKPGAPAPPSALASARIIEDLDSIKYPSGIRTPDRELNQNTANGKFRYDRDFLLQFMEICKDKPDMLPPLDTIGLEKDEHGGAGAYGSMGRSSSRRGTGSGMPPPNRATSMGGAAMPFNKSQLAAGGFSMGNFQPPSRLTSEERFLASSGGRSASTSGPFGPGVGKPAPLVRSISQGGPGGPPSPKDGHHQTGRIRSSRGKQRGAQSNQQQYGTPSGGSELFLDPVAPLQPTDSRWSRQAQPSDQHALVERKVKALLNKLTVEKFENISNQIIEWANKSEQEKDGRTLIQVIKLVFEKATDEATWSEMYAKLCRKMMEKISANVQDDSITNTEGKPITGGQLFRKYLLNRCQEDFERGWNVKEAAVAAAAARAAEDQAAKEVAENLKDGEVVLYSEEYYIAQKAKRQGLGLVKFIGELFKLQMLTERIMHECIKKLLSNVEDPEEEEIESLCKLLTTVGGALDTTKARNHMDIYFGRMSELARNTNINSRMQYMLLDVIELRNRQWTSRHGGPASAAPSTIAQVHEQAAKEKAAAEKEAQFRPNNMSRGGSRRGDHRRDEHGSQPGGWNSVGSSAPPRPPAKAGDLSNFGKISKAAPGVMSFGPASVFTKKGDGKPPSLSRASSSSNMFSALNRDASDPPADVHTSSRPPSRKPSIDLGAGGVPDAPGGGRKKLNLLPRTVSTAPEEVKAEDAATSDAEDGSDGSGDKAPAMTERAKAKIDEDLKEFWSIRNLDEAVHYFDDIPEVHHHILVAKLTSTALDKKEADVELAAGLFERVAEKSCSADAFEAGIFPSIEFLDDMAIDVPKVYPFMARLLFASKLPKLAVESLASKIESDGEAAPTPRDKLIQEYEKLSP